MKRFYLLIFTLLGITGGGVTHAQETVELNLSETATRVNRGSNAWTTGLAGSTNNVWSLPTAESVKATFGVNTFISATGMIWGMCNGNNGEDNDFTNLTSGGFSFVGRQAYTGEYVAQMYVLDYNAKSVNVSFDFTGSEALSKSSFSIWRVTSDAAEMLAGSASNWTEGSSMFSVLLPSDTHVPLCSD